MFKGSKNVEPESHTSIIASVGGRSNAYTTEDETVFWQTLPAQYLPLVLWMEADRMATLRIDDDGVPARARGGQGRAADARREPAVRPAVTRSSTTTPSPRIPTSTRRSAAWPTSRRRRSQDVREFHRTFYVPENATVTIVGDFDAAQALQLVTQYFGRVPKAARPVPRDIPKEPAQTKERRVVVEESWPLPAVVVAYHVTYDGHPDAYPLHITSKILSDGQSARIPRELVYNKRLALTAFGSGNITEDPNLFYAVAIVQPGQTAADGGEGADRRVREAEARAGARRRAAARQEPVRARLHRRPRDRTRRRRCTWRTPR